MSELEGNGPYKLRERAVLPLESGRDVANDPDQTFAALAPKQRQS